MKQGATLEELGRTVAEQAKRRDDLVVDTRRLTMLDGETLVVTDPDGAIGGSTEYAIEQIAHRQIGERLGIPAKFYDRLREAKREDDSPHDEIRRLLDRNVNTLFREAPERRLIRTFKPVDDQTPGEFDASAPGIARCFLSDHYRKRDNDDLLERVVPELAKLPSAKVISCAVTDTRLYLKVVTEPITGEVKRGEPVCAGVVIRNSEVGHGSLSIVPMIYTFVCTNGMTLGWAAEGAKRYAHLGRRIEADGSGRYSDETVKLDDEAFFAKVAEDVRRAVDETAFNAILVQMQEAAKTPRVNDPIEAVERVTDRYKLTDTESGQVLRHLAEGGDLSAWGVLSAVTRTAQDVESYERASELEAIGGDILDLATSKPREWEAIAA